RLAREDRSRGRGRHADERARLSAPVARGDLRVGRALLPPLLLPAAQALRLPQGDGAGHRGLQAAAGRGTRVPEVSRAATPRLSPSPSRYVFQSKTLVSTS